MIEARHTDHAMGPARASSLKTEKGTEPTANQMTSAERESVRVKGKPAHLLHPPRGGTLCNPNYIQVNPPDVLKICGPSVRAKSSFPIPDVEKGLGHAWLRMSEPWGARDPVYGERR